MKRLKALEEGAHNWKRAENIRAYLFAVETKAAREDGSIASESEFGQWIAWARHKADWSDPIINTECPVLGEE